MTWTRLSWSGQSSRSQCDAVMSAEFPGVPINPLFIHGNCGLGKTHLLQGLCKRFIEFHRPSAGFT